MSFGTESGHAAGCNILAPPRRQLSGTTRSGVATDRSRVAAGRIIVTTVTVYRYTARSRAVDPVLTYSSQYQSSAGAKPDVAP